MQAPQGPADIMYDLSGPLVGLGGQVAAMVWPLGSPLGLPLGGVFEDGIQMQVAATRFTFLP